MLELSNQRSVGVVTMASARVEVSSAEPATMAKLAADVSTAEVLLHRADKDYKLEMENRWQYAIPDDILSRISDFLPLADFVIFRSICCSWRNYPSPCSSIVEFSLKDVWCIMYDFDARDWDMCLFYRVGSQKSCIIKLPNLRGATCLPSKHRWLLIHQSNNYIFFHPLTLEEICLPPYPAPPLESAACQVGTYIYFPTSTNCDVVLVSSRDPFTIEIAYCHLADEKWLVDKVNVDAGDVAMGCTLLPDPIWVNFLPSYDICMIDIIICYKTHWLSYDISEKKFKTAKLSSVKSNFNYCDWYSELMEVHSVSKFGAKFPSPFLFLVNPRGLTVVLCMALRLKQLLLHLLLKATWV